MIKGHASGLWRPDVPRFCCRCGALLERDEGGETYDSQTGKPIHYDFTLSCPNGDGCVLVAVHAGGHLFRTAYY